MVRAFVTFGRYGSFLPRQATSQRVQMLFLHGGRVQPAAISSVSSSLGCGSFQNTTLNRTAGIVGIKKIERPTAQGCLWHIQLRKNFCIRAPNGANSSESKVMATAQPASDDASSSAEPKKDTVQGNAKAEERISQWYSDPTACSMPRYALFCPPPVQRSILDGKKHTPPTDPAPKTTKPRRLRGVAGQVSSVVGGRHAACGGLLWDGVLRHDGHPHRRGARPRLPWRSANPSPPPFPRTDPTRLPACDTRRGKQQQKQPLGEVLWLQKQCPGAAARPLSLP
jgi:hypothetical protein